VDINKSINDKYKNVFHGTSQEQYASFYQINSDTDLHPHLPCRRKHGRRSASKRQARKVDITTRSHGVVEAWMCKYEKHEIPSE